MWDAGNGMLGLTPRSPAVGFSEPLIAIKTNLHPQTKPAGLTRAGLSLKQVKSPCHLGVNSSFADGFQWGQTLPTPATRFSGRTAPSL